MISALDDEPEGCTWGDGLVVAPDGSRAGIVCAVGDFATHEILPPDAQRWGVYGFAFPHPVRDQAELVACLREVLPELHAI
jgi:hypothetical protein